MRNKFKTEKMSGRAEVVERKRDLKKANDNKYMLKNGAKNEDVVNIYQKKNRRGQLEWKNNEMSV